MAVELVAQVVAVAEHQKSDESGELDGLTTMIMVDNEKFHNLYQHPSSTGKRPMSEEGFYRSRVPLRKRSPIAKQLTSSMHELSRNGTNGLM